LSAALLLSVSMISSDTNRVAEAIVAAVLIVSICDPVRGLLTIAVLASLLALLPLLPFPPLLPDPPVQPVVLAFLVGWLARQPRRSGPRLPALSAIAAWLFSGFVVVSMVIARTITIPAVAILEGMGVAIAVVELLRRSPAVAVQLPVALGGSVAVVAAVTLIGRIDVSSLSWFAMMFCVASGMTLRDRGNARAMWVVVVLATLGGCVKSFLRSPTQRFDIADAPWVSTVLVLLFVAGALIQSYRGITVSRRDARLIGCIAGVVAFIVAQAGNPARADASIVFFLVLGLTTALAGSHVLDARPFLRTN